MYDMTEYLSHFFMGPFPDRTSAVLGIVSKHGECSLVVGFHGGSWWAKPWPGENFHPEKWPDCFEYLDRLEAGIHKVTNAPFRVNVERDRLDMIRSLFGRDRKAAIEDFDFEFTNWLADDDLNANLSGKPDNIGMASTLAGPDDDIFFRLLAQKSICSAPEQLLGDGRK